LLGTRNLLITGLQKGSVFLYLKCLFLDQILCLTTC